MTKQTDLEAIRAREAAATPGPWHWGGNTDRDDPRLVGGTGRQTVMGMVRRERTADDPETEDFVSYLRETEFYFGETCRHLTDEEIDERVREQWLFDDWGEPVFDMRLAFRDEHGIMQYARDLAVFAVCPEAISRADERVYRADITGLRHPDAVFLEHAREDVRVLLGKVDEQACTIEWAMETIKRLKGELAERTGERDDALRVVEAFMGQHTYDESSVLNPVTGKPYGPGPLWAGTEPMDYPDPRCVCGELWGHDRCSHVEEALQSAAGALPAGLLNAKVRFWVCPQHRQGRVKWFGGIFASCLEWGCEQTSESADDRASEPRKLPVCAGCGHRHPTDGECADHSWGDSCPYDAGADCGQGANAGMPEPCQPIGCDNGHHLAGCAFAEVDAAEPTEDEIREAVTGLLAGMGEQARAGRCDREDVVSTSDTGSREADDA